ncbi:hypothetical protein HMPREF0083_00484 [Aneurinibacillus aneurinilyticus ATCC 12856]|uniref:Uncharacterized protein n=1 Tax=Aneurinibacillus aneurinilyticus ATCC 12856 TaxID=649747 RepID=U1YKU1_ANEAE|nr:hypothetical protein HMPREF0083_00484 [Aneurinibacillus aneurinilyticus ATCC 12856]
MGLTLFVKFRDKSTFPTTIHKYCTELHVFWLLKYGKWITKSRSS